VDAKQRILIVVDEADFLFSASVALQQAEYEVVEAADGGEALSQGPGIPPPGRESTSS